VIQGYLPGQGQNAYIGFFPSPDPGERLYVWTPLDYTPEPGSLPVVRFSVLMNIVDSTNLEYDDFDWQVFNRAGDRLFTLNFDNNNLKIYYQLSGSSPFTNTGFTFDNGVTYALTIVMDFAANRWNAFLNSTQIVTEQPISVGGLPLMLGDIDAVWNPGDAAGNNYMLFDNYLVIAEPDRVPEILMHPQGKSAALNTTVTFGVIARGEETLHYQWRLDGVELAAATGPILTIRKVTPAHAGRYSVQASFP
jgi:hypothetical protein